MHDSNGTPLAVGDHVTLTGTIKEFTSTSPTFCNILFRANRGMAPEHDAEGYDLSLSARMVTKLTAAELRAQSRAKLQPPTTYQDRVIAEKTELDGNLARLRDFFGTQIFIALGEDEKQRLCLQEDAMANYSDILGERIAAFNAGSSSSSSSGQQLSPLAAVAAVALEVEETHPIDKSGAAPAPLAQAPEDDAGPESPVEEGREPLGPQD